MQQPIFSYQAACTRAQEALQLSLRGWLQRADELLRQTQTELRRLSGDIVVSGYRSAGDDAPSLAQDFEEARAWGWYEIAAGVYQLAHAHAGNSMVYFKRVWRIWRPWSLNAATQQQQREACCERLRASLWLGEAWARVIIDRAQQSSRAILRAALTEIRRIQAQDLLNETIQQQRLLPPALKGTLNHNLQGQSIPYVTTLLTTQ